MSTERNAKTYKLIACEILFRELSYLAATSPNRIDIEFLPKGLHDLGRKGMYDQLEKVLETLDETRYDAVLLGYALCSGGIVGLKARSIPLVVPRAHDCITLFLGDRGRYQEYFETNPGVYFKTTGWLERGGDLVPYASGAISLPDGVRVTLEQMIEKYGEDNALYLWDQLTRMVHYSKITYITTGVEHDDSFESEAKSIAEARNWAFETLSGDLRLLQRLLAGNWDENDFLIVRPGESIQFDYSERIIKAVHASQSEREA